MSDEFNPRLRTTLVKLLHTAQTKTSANSLIAELQRQKEKFPKKSLQIILLDVAKTDKLGEQVYKELQMDFKTTELSAIVCLQRFLSAYEKLKSTRKINSRNNIETITEDEEASILQKTQNQSNQSMESVKDTNGNEDNVSSNTKNIPKNLVKISTDGLSKSAHTSALYDSIQNNNTTLSINNDFRIHSQLFFSNTIINSLPSQIIQPNCTARSINEQEQILIEELMYSFIGIPGDFITPKINNSNENKPVTCSFKISDQIDISLRNIAQDLLPMANHYSTIQKFVQWGDKKKNQVLHALSEVIQMVLNDYRLSITQLEKEKINNNLTLHKLHYLIRPNAQKLQILSELVSKITQSDLKSGTILSILYDEITLQTGDQTAQKMLIELTEQASVPYISMLDQWILKGVIIDPYNQFFVVDHFKELSACGSQMDTARYWETWYTVQLDRIPRFLENDADIILRTGKYLNVVRQCGKEIILPVNKSNLQFSATNYSHSTFIKQAYHNASKTLLELLMKELNLMGHISSVKRYFLLQQGDLITQFMDASEKELSKTVDKVFPLCLNNLLQLIVRLSSAKNDPCIEHLFCDLFTMDLMEHMSKINEAGLTDSDIDLTDGENLSLSGLECFAFGYSVDWPLSIVLNQWALSQYQMLFRLLFYCKHVERQLCQVWIQNIEKSKNNTKIERAAFALRQRMLNAIQHLEYYMMIEIIEPNWHIFTEKMRNVQSVDEVLNIHQDFLHICLQNCMLHHPDLLRPLMKICGICLSFCKYVRNDKTSDIETIEKEFNDLLVSFIKELGEQSSAPFLSLVCRLNFNSFYTK